MNPESQSAKIWNKCRSIPVICHFNPRRSGIPGFWYNDNVVIFISSMKSSLISFEIITCLVAFSPSVTAQVVLQAEDAFIYQGIVENEHDGYTGSGYESGNNLVGAYVEWEVSMVDSREQALTFYYANGSTEDRPMEIRVNEVVVIAEFSFSGSGDCSPESISAE